MVAPISREEVQRRGRYSLTIAALFILILASGQLPLPQRGIFLLPLGVAIVVSVRELRRLSRSAATGFIKAGPIVALGLSTLLLGIAALQALLYVPLKEYQDCLGAANTNTARAVCAQQVQESYPGSLTEF